MRGRFSCWILSPVCRMPQHRRHVHIVLFMLINPVWCLRFVRAKPVCLSQKNLLQRTVPVIPPNVKLLLSSSSSFLFKSGNIVFSAAKGALWFVHPRPWRSEKRCARFVISQVCSSPLRALHTYLLSKLFLIMHNPSGNPPPLLRPHFSPFVPMNNSSVKNWAFPFPVRNRGLEFTTKGWKQDLFMTTCDLES